ncbi:hypothetical protein MKY14_28490 [Paenibacillus sp. FSL R5-0887]|jgi:hypothetical protein|uniref:Uncharacterized protein n=1 Tax=Paenibacillus odorifer TaxID=189426 RepID=A0A1R0X8F4_9BACL|nr:hypothetical protein [Paenibacillus odorifer]OMC77466.1 hypothetical protein BK125_13080 [Paenibacillus odorifer]OMD30812.1 hypothetical protein BJP51_00165 [Paenibacillus odorifer]OMD74517.1 hypothetical protein BSK48_01510 [Paenibacillus odorifer]OMD81489.1 hypothetical protein BSK50_01120 [Paenibacillus odorifer]OMD84701.1 hypothetical protein BSK53_11915 [Paenibacillus odorifer]
MTDFFVLRLLDKLRGAFIRFGVDYDTMRSILQIKLTMDGRRTPTALAGMQKKENAKEGSPLRLQWIYLLFGLILIPLTLSNDHYMLQMSLTFGIIMFFVSTTLISDFSSVMLDLRDKNILFSKPVNRTTLNMAKTIHVLLYLGTVTLSITGPSLVFSLFKQGIAFFLMYAVTIVLLDCFILVITALLYLMIMRFFDGEKLKDIINYTQILLTIGIMVGYQFISRLFNLTELGAAYHPAWWQYFIFPVWFAAPFELLLGGAREPYYFILSMLALITPLVLIAAYIKLMPQFERNLQKLAEQGSGGKDKGQIAEWLSRRVCKEPAEGIFFRFTWSMMKNERDFKLKVYPALGFSIAFPFIFIFGILQNSYDGSLKGSKVYLLIYFCTMLMQTVIQMLRYSTSYKGAWIYRLIPLPDSTPIYRGMLKAALLRLVLPLFAVDAVLFILLFGVHIVPDLVVVLFAMLIFSVICFRVYPRSLPFSERYEAAKQKDYTGVAFMLMFLLMGMAGIHYVFTLFTGGIYIYLLVLVVLNQWLWRKTFPKTPSTTGHISNFSG